MPPEVDVPRTRRVYRECVTELRLRAVDVTVAVILFAVALVTAGRGFHGSLTVLAALLAAIACGATVWRRRAPTAVFVVATVAAEGYLAVTQSETGVLVLAAPLVALYTLTETSTRLRAVLLGGLAFLVMLALHATLRPAWAGPQNVAVIALGGLAVAAGEAARSRRAYVHEVEERARQAERDAEQETARRVTEERLRIARELHDVLGHHLALITVHAGAAADVLDDHPAEAKKSLAHIKQAGRTALTELKDVVVLLRRPEDPATPTEPAGSLAVLDELVASFLRSGLRIETDVTGMARPLPTAVDVTAYRVIQESLTNVARHAGDTTATIRLRYEPDQLSVIVDDEGTGGSHAAGHGIAGMRERVTAVGGTLRAGPRPTGGFRVSARVPLGVSR
jgi:signal transduction histidine kinase